MRNLLVVATSVGLSACIAPGAPPVVYVNSGWRTNYGAPITLGELDALRLSCTPVRVATAIDSDRSVPNPIRDNPAYHPGGEALANAPPTGIAADRAIEPGTRLAGRANAAAIDQCLYGKGLIKAR